jgi:hypothetical protein
VSAIRDWLRARRAAEHLAACDAYRAALPQPVGHDGERLVDPDLEVVGDYSNSLPNVVVPAPRTREEVAAMLRRTMIPLMRCWRCWAPVGDGAELCRHCEAEVIDVT